MGGVPAVLRSFEPELHANTVKLISTFKTNRFNEHKLVHSIGCVQVLDSLEQEELIRLLFIHDEILAGHNSQDLKILGNLHRNDLIWLSVILVSSLEWDYDFALLNL